MVGVEHLRAERQPSLAVLEQVAEAVRIGLDRHAGKRAQRIEENLFDLVGMDVDFHDVVLLVRFDRSAVRSCATAVECEESVRNAGQ